MSSSRGIALVLAVLVTSFLTAIGLGLALIVMMDRLATGNVRGSVAMLYAADAAMELAVRDLARLEDWNAVLAGEVRSTFVDGEPWGMRDIPGGGGVDLTAMTHQLNCAGPTACSEADMDASSPERPWGYNNPRWRLFAYGPMGKIVQFGRPPESYLAVWVADDSREEDDDPHTDAVAGAAGHGILRVRAEAYGPVGARRALEADVVRQCLGVPEACQMRTGVQFWRELRQIVP